MSERTKLILMSAAVVILVGIAGFVSYNSLRDNSQPTISPGYLKLSPEERERKRQEGLARRAMGRSAGQMPAGAPQ